MARNFGKWRWGGWGRGGGGVGANLAKCGILYYTSIIILDHSL